MEKCPICQGKGLVVMHYGNQFFEWDVESCPLCEGKGTEHPEAVDMFNKHHNIEGVWYEPLQRGGWYETTHREFKETKKSKPTLSWVSFLENLDSEEDDNSEYALEEEYKEYDFPKKSLVRSWAFLLPSHIKKSLKLYT